MKGIYVKPCKYIKEIATDPIDYVNIDGVMLTFREAEVVQAIIFSDGEQKTIAKILKIDVTTVRYYYNQLKKKLGYYSTKQLIQGIHKKYGE